MSRAYHSASSIKTACDRAWAYTYLDGMREADVPWSEIEAGRKVEPRVRSLSLGKAVHAVGEHYYAPARPGAAPGWESLPGAIFASGVHLLPRPDACTRIEVEAPIGREPCHESPNGVALRVHGIAWVGFRDLRVDYAGRTDTPAATLQVDYKTSSSIASWALTAEQLASDVQCALYTLDLCDRLGITEVRSRWLYLETKRVRRALPVDVTLTREQALSVIEPAADRARRLDAIPSSAAALQNLDACAAYGGCRFHVSAGGPCTAVRSLKSAYAQLKGSHMALDSALASKFAALAAPAAPPAPPAPEAPAAAFSSFGATPAAPPAPEAPPPAEPAKRTRKPRATAALTPDGQPVVVMPAPAVGGLAARLALAAANLATIEAAYNDALDAIDAILEGR